MSGKSPILALSPAWQKAHPQACMGVLAMENISQPKNSPELEEASQAVEAELASRFTDRRSIKDHPVIQAYTAYYKKFKKTYHVAAQAESVALKERRIPRFTPLVQAMFTAELKNMLLTAGHDLDQVRSQVRLDSSKGHEILEGMGGGQQQLKAGDMLVTDEQGILSTIIYGPAERAKIGKNTTKALFTVYGVPQVAVSLIEHHLMDIQRFIRLFAPEAGTLELGVYSA